MPSVVRIRVKVRHDGASTSTQVFAGVVFSLEISRQSIVYIERKYIYAPGRSPLYALLSPFSPPPTPIRPQQARLTLSTLHPPSRRLQLVPPPLFPPPPLPPPPPPLLPPPFHPWREDFERICTGIESAAHYIHRLHAFQDTKSCLSNAYTQGARISCSRHLPLDLTLRLLRRALLRLLYASICVESIIKRFTNILCLWLMNEIISLSVTRNYRIILPPPSGGEPRLRARDWFDSSRGRDCVYHI